jgi:hypothetical protein
MQKRVLVNFIKVLYENKIIVDDVTKAEAEFEQALKKVSELLIDKQEIAAFIMLENSVLTLVDVIKHQYFNHGLIAQDFLDNMVMYRSPVKEVV